MRVLVVAALLSAAAVVPVRSQEAQDTTKPTPSLAKARQLQTKVWVNTGSGVYHGPGTTYYGKTKQGEYMNEAQARGSGYRAAQATGCGDGPTEAPEAPPNSVWVNLSSGIYFCPGAGYFGKTKKGKYLTEADAKAAGYRPAGGKTCFD